MELEVVARDQHLVINGQMVELSETVADTLVLGEVVVARVDSDRMMDQGDRSLNRNVLAFDGFGKPLWVIQEAPDGDDDWPKPYTAIAKVGQDLVAKNWVGVDYKVDLETGHVEARQSAGRPW